MNIFVGNLSFEAIDADVKKLFEGFGNVASVVIVMRKEKKAPKSRGFGFVQMPDEQQALAAIAALSGKEFMGRILNVDPARPKTETERKSELKKKIRPLATVETEQRPLEEGEQKKPWFNPVFRKPGAYKGGRRTHSYIKRRGLAGMQEEAKPRQRSQDNPMRWRKKGDQPKPWQKSPVEHKPWKKPTGDAKPWSKSNGRPQKSRFESRRKTGGYKA